MAKLTTAEILAKARRQDGGGAGATKAPAAASAPDVPSPAPTSSEGAPPEAASPLPPTKTAKPAAAPGPRPTSTSDILAKARAQAAAAAAGAAETSPAPTAEPTGAAKPASAKPAAAASTPKTTSDILAAARAQAAGTPSAAAPSAPKAEKAAARPSADKPRSAAGGGDRPSVQEMLKQARQEPAPERAAEGASPPLPALPRRPAPSKVRPADERRGFLRAVGYGLLALVATPFAAGWTAFTAASIAATLGMARFMMPNVMVEPPSKFKVGPPDDYPLGTVTTKWKSEYAIWITHQLVNQKSQIYALSTVCTHLGCTPNWLEGEQKFKCPCHGSGFYATGINFEGPAPRPLERYGISIASDGMLEVDKGVKFQEELGQWNDPASFVVTG